MMRVDLHLHSSASDGQYTPTEVVAHAINAGLDIIALTDHDTTAGISEAQSAASKSGLLLVLAGIELSAEDSGGDVHMLGYLIDIEDAAFQQRLAQFRHDRQQRGIKILQRLDDLGKGVTWEKVQAIADGGAIGRPHIARALVEAGHAYSVKDAFDRYLHNGGPAYVARQRLSPEEAIELIHSAGGVAVLAHPGLLAEPRAMVQRLVPAGLDGVELVHPMNDARVRMDLRGLAQQHDLIMTGGSDFHGADIKEGAILGSLNPPEGCVAALRARARRYARRSPG